MKNMLVKDYSRRKEPWEPGELCVPGVPRQVPLIIKDITGTESKTSDDFLSKNYMKVVFTVWHYFPVS